MAKGGKRPGAGRPKGTVASHTILAQEMRKALIEAAAEEWGPIVKALITSAKHGDAYAIRELFDRIFGKASQPVEMSGELKLEIVSFKEPSSLIDAKSRADSHR
jgi:hypothetical protein